jgi:hypothetical protein
MAHTLHQLLETAWKSRALPVCNWLRSQPNRVAVAISPIVWHFKPSVFLDDDCLTNRNRVNLAAFDELHKIRVLPISDRAFLTCMLSAKTRQNCWCLETRNAIYWTPSLEYHHVNVPLFWVKYLTCVIDLDKYYHHNRKCLHVLARNHCESIHF